MTTGLRLVRGAQEGVALEAALFKASEPDLVVWAEQSHGIFCPEALRRKNRLEEPGELENWPIVTRPTGGGTVPQGLGLLNLAISYDAAMGASIENG